MNFTLSIALVIGLNMQASVYIYVIKFKRISGHYFHHAFVTIVRSVHLSVCQSVVTLWDNKFV